VAKIDFAGTVVCDAGPLIHLDELGALDLLSDFDEVLVADAVWQEVSRHRASALRRRTVKLQRRRSPPEPSPELAQLAKTFSLSSGEMAALRLVQETPGGMLLTDDAAARLVAERVGYEVHGTLGVLVRTLRRRQRTKRQVLNLLRAIPRRSTLFIDKQLLAMVIEQVHIA
jgi:predicted nucleic acid-binding protein